MLIILGPYDPQIINITSVLRTFWAILDSHRGNVNNFGPHDPQMLNSTSVSRTFWAILDSHRGNVNNISALDTQIINITSVSDAHFNNFPPYEKIINIMILRQQFLIPTGEMLIILGLMTPKLLTLPAFYALFEKLLIPTGEMLSNFGPHDPKCLTVSVLRMFKQFLIPLNWTYPPALGFLLPAQTLILCLESKPTCHKIAMIESWKEKR